MANASSFEILLAVCANETVENRLLKTTLSKSNTFFIPPNVISTIVDEHIESILGSRRQIYIKLTKKATNKLKNFCFC